MEEVKESRTQTKLRQRKAFRTRSRFPIKLAAALVLFSALAATILINSDRGKGVLSAPPKSSVAAASSAFASPKQPSTLAELLALPRERLDSCDIALLNLLCAEGLPGAENLNVAASLATLDQFARRVDFDTRRHLYRFHKAPAEFDHSEAKFRMLMLGVTLQTNFAVRYNPARITPAGVFEPNHVFFADSRDVLLHGLAGERRMGTCSSLPVLYVAVGRRLGYPLKLVKTKSHLLARWDSPTERFNIEATGRGVGWYDDDHFKQWPIPVSDQEIAEFGLLKSLTPAQELATFLSIRGHCLQAAGRTEDAIAAFEHACRLDPDSRAHRLLLAAARQQTMEGNRLIRVGFDHPEINPDVVHAAGRADLPVGLNARPHFPSELRLPPHGFRGATPGLPRPGPVLPSFPQPRIQNSYPQGGP